MKLLWSSRSPFVRKVMVAAHEVGVAQRIATERVLVGANKPNPEVMAVNPLNKIPTLVLDDGTRPLRLARDLRVSRHAARRPQADSRRSRRPLRGAAAPGARRRPDGAHRAAARRAEPAAADPVREAPRRLPPQDRDDARSPWTTEADRFEAQPDIGQIAIACALSHLDFRFAADNWREGRPRLARWHAASPSARRCWPPSTSTPTEVVAQRTQREGHAPMIKPPQSQIPGVYHRRVGDIVVTAISDGFLDGSHRRAAQHRRRTRRARS